MAAVEPSKSAEPLSLYVKVDSNPAELLVCTLDGQTTRQVPLDLIFVEGMEVTLTVKGNGKIHLTGYLAPEQDDYFDEYEDGSSGDEEEEVSEDELSPAKVPPGQKRGSALSSNVPVKKAKTQESPLEKTNGKANGKVTAQVESEDDEDDDDDEGESDEDALSDDGELEKMLAGLKNAKNAANSSGDMSIDDEELDDEEDDEDDDDDDDEEEEEDEQVERLPQAKAPIKKQGKDEAKKPQAKPQQQQGQKPQQQGQKPQQFQKQKQQQQSPKNFNAGGNFNKKQGTPFGGNKTPNQQGGGGKSPGGFNKPGGNTPFNKNKARNQFGSGQKFSGKKH